MSAPPSSDSVVRLAELVFPSQTNHYGTLFAGTGLALMAKAAVIAATRRAKNNAVMAAVEKVSFDAPVRVGETLELTAEVIRVGRSSMTVHVSGFAEGMPHGIQRQVMVGWFELVAVDPAGRPTPIPGSN